MYVQEEGRLAMEMEMSTLLATQGKNQKQAKQKGKGRIVPQGGIKKESKCFFFFFCKKKGHEEGLF